MTWRELPPLITDAAAQLPELEGISLVAGRIGNYTVELWPEERPAIARAQERRVHEFSTGRRLARFAMAELGLPAAAIARAEDRSPVWPASMKGSITHAGDVAVAAVTRAHALAGLGIDLERTERVTGKLFARIFTPAECELLDNADPRMPGVLFSAKEAGYKAVNPGVGRYIGFHEAEVDVNWEQRSLRLRYLGSHEPNRIMEQGVGHFCFFERYVLTVFMIP
jgi:4'-phosphopantetheinyl transferase EntD